MASFHDGMLCLALTCCCLLFQPLAAQTTKFYDDSLFVDFDYNPLSAVGPDEWQTVDTSTSEWAQYDEGHPLFDLGIPGDGEPSNSMCGGPNGPFPNLRDSPLVLSNINTCEDTHEMLTRQISQQDCTREDLTFRITPHTLKAYVPASDDNCIRPTINLSGFANDFVLTWMEVHARSEHVLADDGKRYDAELQMVHMGTNDANYMTATVSVLVDATAKTDDAEFQYLLDGWQNERNTELVACGGSITGDGRQTQSQGKKNNRKGKETNKGNDDRRAASLQLQQENSTGTLVEEEQQGNLRKRRLLVNEAASPCYSDKFGRGCEPLGPRRKMYPYTMWPTIHYYGYRGSLTTPPCADVVNWRILDEPMKISRRQYKQLTALLKSSSNDSCSADSRVSLKGENFRPLQTHNAQEQSLFHCKHEDFSFWMYPPEEQ